MKLSETGENSHMRGREQTLLHFRGLGKKITSRFKKGQGIFNLGRGIFENTTSPVDVLVDISYNQSITISLFSFDGHSARAFQKADAK